MALVRTGMEYWFVDKNGVKLPEKFQHADVTRVVFTADGQTNVRVIEGVRSPPPVYAGQRWPGEDLASGLDLVRHLYGQPFANDIVKVKVDNFGGRIDSREAQIVLVTRYNTEIRWGRAWASTDAFIEVRPEYKMERLRRIVAEYGRVDAKERWIDIRFDKIGCPNPAAATTTDLGPRRRRGLDSPPAFGRHADDTTEGGKSMLAAENGVAASKPVYPADRTASRARPTSPLAPLITWLLVQGAALAIAAARIPLSAHYPQAGERLAIDLVLAAQIGASAALFPWLMRDWRAAVVTVCAAWPFIAFAAVLSALPPVRTAAVAAFVTGWLVVLALWNTGLTSPKWRLIGSAVTILASIGGALLWYLRVEFAAPASGNPPADGRYGPLVAAIGVAR